MAVKQEKLAYLQMPLPAPSEKKTVVKVNWSGFNGTQVLDTGELSFEKNISTLEAPYLTPSPKHVMVRGYYSDVPIGMFGFDDFLVVITKGSGTGSKVKVEYVTGQYNYK
jgi:hypothetical protein